MTDFFNFRYQYRWTDRIFTDINFVMLLFSVDGFDKPLIFSSCQNLGTKYDFFSFW